MANVFPTTLNDWADGETIESAWADALESKIGIDNSIDVSSIDYLIKNSASKLGSIANITPTDGVFIVANGTKFIGESGATARTSLGVGTGDSPQFIGVLLSGLTASELVATDGSKNLVSLAVATYPSLTELSYVKGVSSAIQTQMNLKAPLVSPTFTTPNLGTPSAGTLTNCTGLPLTGLVSDTTTALGIGSINLGHATDTTIARVSAGVVSIEGKNIYMAGGDDVAFPDGGTGISSLTQYLIPYAATTTSIGQIAIGTSGQVLTSNGAGAAPTFQAATGGASTALDNLASVNINAALNSTSANLEIKTTTTGLLLLNPAERNVIIGAATTGFSTIAATRAALTIAGTTDAGVLEFGAKTATNSAGILRLTGYNGATAVSSIQSDSNAATNNTGHWNFFVNNGAGLISGFKIESDGGVFLANLLAAAASTDVNINGSNELHSVTSSKRFKENITNVKQDTSGIYDLKVREYDFKEKFGGQHEVGIIAEEAINVLPQLVVLDKNNKPYSFQYSRLSVFLLAEIQKLQKRIKTLELSSN